MAYRSSSSARVLAPLSLVAAAIAVLVVIASGGSDATTSAPPSSVAAPSARTSSTTTSSSSTRKTYTVKPGDTLSAIATKTGVPLDRIQELNPSLDAQTLNTGDKIKLAPSSSSP